LRELPVEDITFSDTQIDAKKGFTCTNARHITFNDVEINPEDGPAMTLNGAADIDTNRLHSRTLAAGAPLVQSTPPDSN
jgi:hypothetical protein